MEIMITDRYMTTDQFNSRNGIPIVAVWNGYDRKDALKSLGYRFNGVQRTWEKVIEPLHFTDLLAETAIACKLTPKEMDRLMEVISNFLGSEKGASYNGDFTVDGLSDRYNAYCDSIGY